MIEIKVPELAESITEGTISQWLKNVGDQVNKGEYILELETDKVNLEVNAEDSGVLTELLKEPGDTVEVGEVIAKLDENGEAGGSSEQAQKEEASPPIEESKTDTGNQQQSSAESKGTEEKQDTSSQDQERPIASPAARKLARELGVDLNSVQSRDPLGRVRPEDVKAAAEQPKQQPEPKKETASKSSNNQNKQQDSEDPTKPAERVKMSRRRQTIAKRLVEVQQNSAMLTTFNEVDMSAILDLRSRRKEAFLKEHDVKLGFMSFFTKAVVGALKKYPKLNAEIQGDEILIKKFYDIGMAVSAEEGLVVPVVRHADQLGFAEIEKEIGSLAKKARNNSLQLKELTGGTFTITNGGIFGSLLSTPILNAPQVGILGMHKIQTRPVAIDDERMENRPMMYVALSYDHRIVDGAEAVSFLATLKSLLEDPESLLLEG